MKSVTEAFGEGDLRPLFQALDDNVVWKSAVADGEFGGEATSRIGVVMKMSKLSTTYSYQRLEAKDIVSAGDVVWGLFEAEVNFEPGAAATSRKITFDMALRWRLKNGKIIEHQSFFDTAAFFAQQKAPNRQVRIP